MSLKVENGIIIMEWTETVSVYSAMDGMDVDREERRRLEWSADAAEAHIVRLQAAIPQARQQVAEEEKKRMAKLAATIGIEQAELERLQRKHGVR